MNGPGISAQPGQNNLTCPYNPAHRILEFRMQNHLIKCRKNYPDVNMVPCPFNPTHIIKEPELKFHVERCPDRRHFEENIYKRETEREDDFIAKLPKIQQDPDEESWDNANAPNYDPTEHILNKKILRVKIGVQPKQRKEFREAERQRIRNLEYEQRNEVQNKPVERLLKMPGKSSQAESFKDMHSKMNRITETVGDYEPPGPSPSPIIKVRPLSEILARPGCNETTPKENEPGPNKDDWITIAPRSRGRGKRHV